jgi:hypothetical protein
MKTSLAVTTSDAAFMIHHALGPDRDWSETLKDMRRDRVDYEGLKLKPFGKLKMYRSQRPAYRMKEVERFILNARIRCGVTIAPSPIAPDLISPQLVEDDPANTLHWRVRKLTLHYPASV